MSKPAGHQARKRFGQNFLQDANIISNIIRSIAPRGGQNIVEIGPGLGALTERLLAAADGRLNVIELDRDLVSILRAKYFNYPQLAIHEGDALKFDFSTLATAPGSLRIVGNLPYNISTPLIFHLLAHVNWISDMHFMLQREVVERMAAQVGDRNYGRLGIMLQYYCRVEPLFNVPPTAFEPRPKVDSAIVRITPHAQLPVTARNTDNLEKVVRSAFGQRRKTIQNALKSLTTGEQLQRLGIDPSLRAEKLTLQNFVTISDTL